MAQGQGSVPYRASRHPNLPPPPELRSVLDPRMLSEMASRNAASIICQAPPAVLDLPEVLVALHGGVLAVLRVCWIVLATS